MQCALGSSNAPWMHDEGLHIPQTYSAFDERKPVHELDCTVEAGMHFKRQHSAATRHLPARGSVPWVSLQEGISDATNLWMGGEHWCDRQCIRRVDLHTQLKCFEAPHHKEAGERRQSRACQVAQTCSSQ